MRSEPKLVVSCVWRAGRLRCIGRRCTNTVACGFVLEVRDQFLARELDLSSLDSLNRQFTQWVEEYYNAQVHSILGMSPLDRFALDRKWVRFLPPNEANDELFFVEEGVMSAPIIPSPSNRCALKRPATCRTGPSTSASNARSPPCASSFITRVSAWGSPPARPHRQ